MGHSRYSPSKGKQLMLCLASNWSQRLIPDTSSAEADDGSATHELARLALTTGSLAAEHIGSAITIGERTFVVDEERARYAQGYMDRVFELVAGYEKQGCRVEIRVEQTLDLSQTIGQEGETGTADVMLLVYWPDRTITVVIIDLKYGRGVRVEAADNVQLMIYADGALNEVDLLGEVREVMLVIDQPRLEHYSEWTTTATACRSLAADYREQVQQSERFYRNERLPMPSDYTPGAEQCRFCRAKASCPALRAKVQQETRADFEDETPPMFAEEIPQLSRTDLARAMDNVELIEIWCHAIRAEMERALLAGEEIDGWKLVQGRKGIRQWRNAEEAEALFKSMRLNNEQMYDYKLISPTTAEKLFKAEIIGKRQWPKVQELISQADGKPSVARESDKRPAVSVTATADAFDAINQEP